MEYKIRRNGEYVEISTDDSGTVFRIKPHEQFDFALIGFSISVSNGGELCQRMEARRILRENVDKISANAG